VTKFPLINNKKKNNKNLQNFMINNSTYSEKIRSRYHRIRMKSYEANNKKKDKLFKPIFIIGFPHSGTSVLTSIFKDHPLVANWTEASEVWEPYWEENLQDDEYDKLTPKYEKDVKQVDIMRISDAFNRFLKSQKKDRILNKNPRNTVRINYIKKIFPDAKIVHIIRDGREVVNSLTRNTDGSTIEKICERWINSINEVKSQSSKILKSDFYEMYYEDFCDNPKKNISKAYEKCELPLIEKQLNRIPDKLQNFNGKWREEMKVEFHSLVRKKLEPTMLELGYRW